MDRLCLTDAQWAKMNRIALASQTDPGRSGERQPAVCGSGAVDCPNRQSMARSSGLVRQVEQRCSSATAIGSKPMFSSGIFEPARMSRTWNTPWSMPPSSRSTATDRAQKGDSKPGHRPVQRRHDHQDPGAHRCVRQSRALRPAAGPALRHGRRCPAHRRDRVSAD